MVSLGAIHFVYDNKVATEESIKSFKKFYPNNYYCLIEDAGIDHIELTKKYSHISSHRYDTNLGYFGKNGVSGYSKSEVLEWLHRFYVACKFLDTTHVVMMEDDVHILNPVTLKDTDEVLGHGGPGNTFPQELINIITDFSGIKPNYCRYGAGGGTIFNVKTYLDNYHKIRDFLIINFDHIHKIYPEMGWMDCFMDVFYFLCGKTRTNSTKLYNIWPESRSFDLNQISDYEIVHGYKKYYR